MKKLLLLFVLFTIFHESHSQSVLGLSAGTHETTFSNSHQPNQFDSKKSYITSLYFKKRKKRFFNSGFELNYMQKEADAKAFIQSDDRNGEISGTFKLGYMSFAFLPEIKIGKNLLVYANAGPSIGMMVSSFMEVEKTVSEMVDGSLTASEISQSGDAKQYFGNPELSFSYEFGIELPLLKVMKITVQNRHDYGLTNLAKGDLTSFDNKITSRGVSWKAGILFKL